MAWTYVLDGQLAISEIVALQSPVQWENYTYIHLVCLVCQANALRYC